MMNQLQGVMHAFKPGKTLAAGILIFSIALLTGAVKCQAQTGTIYYWIDGAPSDVWSSPTAWTTTGASGFVPFPTTQADCLFTNAATYAVNFDANGNNNLYGSNVYANAAFTSATVTFNIPSGLEDIVNVLFSVGPQANSTSTVWLASNGTAAAPGFDLGGGSVALGGNGIGTLIITNGVFSALAQTITLGSGTGGQGHLVLSGPSVQFLCNGISVGDASNSLGGSSIVVSNSAYLQDGSSFRVGSSSAQTSSSNTLVIASGGLMQLNSGPEVVGNRGTGAISACIDNGVTVMNGGVWRAAATTAHQIVIGDDFLLGQSSTAQGLIVTGNYVTVMAGGAITNCREISVTYSNSFNLLGGLVALGGASVSNSGSMKAYGTVNGGVVIGNGGTLNPLNNATLNLLNNLGSLVVSNGFTLGTNGTMNVQLGSTYNPLIVALVGKTNSLTTLGTMNFSDSGGFATGIWTIISFQTNALSSPVNTITNTPILGTVPSNPGFVYAFTTNNPLELDLVVTCPTCSGPSDPFTTWQNQYFTVAELGTPSFSGPNADPFGKGMSNTNQFLAGFNPTNAAAYLHITAISKTNSSTDIRVDYLGASGNSSTTPPMASRTNVLEFTTGTGGNYNSNGFVSTGVINILSGGTGAGLLTNMVDPGGATNKPARYYRVRVIVP